MCLSFKIYVQRPQTWKDVFKAGDRARILEGALLTVRSNSLSDVSVNAIKMHWTVLTNSLT